eukprot:CCRYP_009889-RB/>CCRYP_009889-RB protein AED:0.64 eAED:0.26 QI:0/-1/0/1/-1/1/1/0/386
MARANMLHATLHWPDHSFIDLWPLAMNYAVWAYNKLPQHGAGLSPEELFSGIRCSRSNLPRAHVFGCPVYVLDPRLQDGKKIPKWGSRARQGIFVGFSPHHSTSVPLILNPRTQHISPQFHVSLMMPSPLCLPSPTNLSWTTVLSNYFPHPGNATLTLLITRPTPNSSMTTGYLRLTSPQTISSVNRHSPGQRHVLVSHHPPKQRESLPAMTCRHHRLYRLRPWLQRENLNLLCPTLRFQRECPCPTSHLHQTQPQTTCLPNFLPLHLLMTPQRFLPQTLIATPLATALALGKMVQPSTVNTPRGNGKLVLRRHWPFPSMHWHLRLCGPNPLLPLLTLVSTTLGATPQLAYVMANSLSFPSSNMTGRVSAPLSVTASLHLLILPPA